MEHVNEKSSLTSSGSDHEVMDSWTFVDESRNSGQQQQPETSGNVKEDESQPPNTETKTDKYHLSVDQDNDTELSDGISIISDSDCGGRHSPEVPPKEAHSHSTDTSLSPPAEIPASDDKRLIEVDKRLVEKEEEADLVRGIFGISRRHVVFVVLLAGISGAMFGHIFRMNPGPPCDCTKLIEPLMNRVYDLEVENFRLRDEVTKLTKQILSDLQTPINPSTNPHQSITPQEPQEENLWETLEATVKPLVDESICGSDTGEELFDDYYGKLCREAENRVKEARKAIEEEPQKTPWKADEINNPVHEEKKQERKFDERKREKKDEWKNSKEKNTKEKRKDYRDSHEGKKDFGKNSKEDRRDYKKNSHEERDSKEDKREFKKNSHDDDDSKEDRRDYKKDSRENKRDYKKDSHEDDDSKENRRENRNSGEDRRGSREDRRNSREHFDERRRKDDNWSGEEYRKREKSEKMKKGERKDFKDSRERKNGGKYEKKNGKKWEDDDDDDSREKFDTEWHEKRMQGREQFRDKESDENNSNWYLERGSDREIKRLRVDGSRDRRR